MKTIDFAIDLGTTNSLITKYENGSVKVFKNPRGFKDSLPSVVGFRKNGVIIGEKAKELKDRDTKNVISSFKRKIGTDEKYFIENENRTVLPQELSSLILKELRTFVNDETLRSCVITIPASFSTVQSNATKKAGYDAGFEEIVLLQEPIAASLAVFNQTNGQDNHGKWLVFDLGGGTFDVAIVDVSENDLKVLDHDGNNFLGGLDFDTAIVNDIIIPKLADIDSFKIIVNGLRNGAEDSKNRQKFEMLLVYAEQLKMELTSYDKAFCELVITDDNGETQYVDIEMTISQFNKVIEPFVDNTLGIITSLLERNTLDKKALKEIVLVGGSTYIPYVKTRIQEEFGVEINKKVDPSTAIAIGAAYYAGNKESRLENEIKSDSNLDLPSIEFFYDKNSRENSALVMANCMNYLVDHTLRVVRSDLSYDSGYLSLNKQMYFQLPLLEKVLNEYSVTLYKNNVLVPSNYGKIAIRQGFYSIDGQPIPQDISIEVDDLDRKETVLDPIFLKNDILPLVKTIYKTVSKDMLSRSNESISINILEGDKNASPSTNLLIGQIQISPKTLNQNLYKGTDLAIKIEMTESRDLRITLNLMNQDYEITESFTPNQRSIDEPRLRKDLEKMIVVVSKELEMLVLYENFEEAAKYQNLQKELENCKLQLGTGKVMSDTLYSVDEQKRQLAGRFDILIRDKEILEDIQHLRNTIYHAEAIITSEEAVENLKHSIEEQVKIGKNSIQKSNIKMIRFATKRLNELMWDHQRNSPEHLKSIFISISMYPSEYFKKAKDAERIKLEGRQMMENSGLTAIQWSYIVNALYNCLKPEYQNNENSDNQFSGTGLE